MKAKYYSYYSSVHRAFVHLHASNKKEVLSYARSQGDKISSSDIADITRFH